jgi:Na+/proline symporter
MEVITPTAPALIIFIIAIIIMAIIYRKWAASIESYVVAKRAASPWLNGLALFSTYNSAWAVLGGPGVSYSYGIVEFATFIGWAIGVFIILWYYLPIIRDLGAKYGATGLASYMETYYGKRYVGIIAGIIAWYATLFYLVGQIKGIGLVISYGTGISYDTAALSGVIIALIYLILSGLRAVLFVNALCTLIMMTFCFCSLYLLFALGGGNIFNTINTMYRFDPKTIYPTGEPYTTDPITLWLFSTIVYSMWQFTPYAWQNYLALRSSKKTDLSIFVTLATVSGAFITWISILGPVGRVFLPYELKDPDTVVLEVSKYFLPSLYPIFICGLFATVLATLDSALLAASTDLYHAIKGFIKPLETRIGGVNTLRIILIGTSFLVCYFAIVYMPVYMVYTMLIGMTGVSAALTGPLAVGLKWRKDPLAAVTSLIISLIAAQLLVFYGITPWLTGCFVGLILSAIIYIIVTLARSH